MQRKSAERRIAALALALGALVLGYFALVHWWFVAPQRAMAQEMQQLRAREHRYAAIIAERGTVQARLAHLRQGQQTSRALLADSDPSAAAASLMQHVVDVVAAHQALGPCTVTQKMPVSAEPGHGPYRKVTVNISLRCAMHALAAVLYDLEEGKPYLFVEDFSAFRNTLPRPDGGLPPLQVQFSLSGYVRHGPGGAP